MARDRRRNEELRTREEVADLLRPACNLLGHPLPYISPGQMRCALSGLSNGGDEGNQVGLHEPIINRLPVIEQVSILDDRRVSLIMVFQVLLASAHNASRPGGSEYKLPDHSPQHLFKTEVQ